MVIDKTSQRGTERGAVTGGRQGWAEAGRTPGFLSKPRGSRTHKQMEGTWKGKGRLLKYKKKKRGDIWRQRRKGWWPRVRLGTQVSTNACGSEIPLNACTVMKPSGGCFHHRRVFAHIAGCHTVPPGWLYHQSVCVGRFGVQTPHWGIFIDIPFNAADTDFSSVYIKNILGKSCVQFKPYF